MEQAISEWKEMYASFYEYKDCSAVLVERKENDGTVDKIFTLDITYMSGQPESDKPEHFIADMKASYPADNPEDITLWMGNIIMIPYAYLSMPIHCINAVLSLLLYPAFS